MYEISRFAKTSPLFQNGYDGVYGFHAISRQKNAGLPNFPPRKGIFDRYLETCTDKSVYGWTLARVRTDDIITCRNSRTICY